MSFSMLSLFLFALPLAASDYTSDVAGALAILHDYDDPTLITPYCQGVGSSTSTVTVTSAPSTSTTTISCVTTSLPPLTSYPGYSNGGGYGTMSMVSSTTTVMVTVTSTTCSGYVDLTRIERPPNLCVASPAASLLKRASWCTDRPCRLVQYSQPVIYEACAEYLEDEGYTYDPAYSAPAVVATVTVGSDEPVVATGCVVPGDGYGEEPTASPNGAGYGQPDGEGYGPSDGYDESDGDVPPSETAPEGYGDVPVEKQRVCRKNRRIELRLY